METKSLQHINKNLLFLNRLESIVYNLNTKNINESVKKVMDIFDTDFPHSFFHIISQLIFSSIVSQKGDFDFVIQFLKMLQEKNEEHIKIKYTKNKLFSMLNFSYRPQESYYIIEKMIEQGLVDPSFVKSQPTYYFAHYFSKDEIISMNFNNFKNYFTKHKEKLSNNNCELHKKYVKEGVNPNEISKIIRNDEIEKLQEMTVQNDFDFNQKIEPSLYERYSFINEENVSLIDYAAFLDQLIVLDFLLLNGANVNKTGKYAIAGANLEIIHLCEQNHTDFRDTYEIAIEYHRNDIFKYMYDKKIYQFKDLAAIGRKCIIFFNYELLSFLEEEGMKTNDVLVNESAKIGNIYLVKHFLEGYDRIPTNILYCSIISENIELVKYIIKEKKFDVNTKNIYIIFFTVYFIQNIYLYIIWNYFICFEEPIITVSLNNNIEILKFFLENYKFNINVNVKFI